MNNGHQAIATHDTSRPYPYEERGRFSSYQVTGYDNTGRPGGDAEGFNLSCASAVSSAEIGVQKPFDLTDDLVQIAQELDDHPMVWYTQKVFGNTPGTFHLKTVVDQSWDRLAGSCVLLKDRDVFLCITRIIFHDDARKDHCQISFLRGQIFDRSWVHMDNYVLNWKGQDITFPRIFDTATDFVEGGEVYGPEDPRIIVEEGVEDAEPVIIFNMISEKATWKRAMWVFRPFSGHSSILTIRGEERAEKEKNWAPFFVEDPDNARGLFGKKEPNQYIHFVYSFQPLLILKCSLVDGVCDHAFAQDIPNNMLSHHENEWSEIRGGTQWVPIPLFSDDAGASKNGLQAFFSIPRTHTEQTSYCYKAVYRPEMTIMVTNGTSFYLTYVSNPLDFGVGVLLQDQAFTDPCKSGRIIILNSIADWDFNARTAYTKVTDVMTVTATVNDATVQAMRISGILKLIKGLPSIQALIKNPASVFGDGKAHKKHDKDYTFLKHSAVGLDIRKCAEEAARSYVDDHSNIETKLRVQKEGLKVE